MAKQTTDVVVVGAGVMGCATAYHLARDGARVLLLDQFAIGHPNGSSHGPSRIFRLAYDKLEYIELARSAHQMWRGLEIEANTQLLQRIGGLDIGRVPLLDKLQETMQSAGVPFELLNRDEIIRYFTQFAPPENTSALYQADYGILAADRCVTTLAARAREYGAIISEYETVRRIVPENESVRVETDTCTYHSGRVILAAGSWLSQLTKQLGLDLHLKVILGLNAYFAPHDVRAFLPDRFPVFIHHFADPNVLAGGVPIFGQSGVKLIFDYIAWDDKLVDPPSEIDSSRLDALRAYANNILPSLDGNIIATDICRYTFTLDSDFILDFHPLYHRVILASPCSGHGFKFGILIGRILADLALSGTTPYNITAFRLDRAALQATF